MSAKDIILKNSKGEHNTFIGILHEESRIEVSKFLILFDAIVEITNSGQTERALDTSINKIQSYLLTSIISHLDSNDLFFIANFDKKITYDVIERLNIVTEYYFKGINIKEELFNDSLSSIRQDKTIK